MEIIIMKYSKLVTLWTILHCQGPDNSFDDAIKQEFHTIIYSV